MLDALDTPLDLEDEGIEEELQIIQQEEKLRNPFPFEIEKIEQFYSPSPVVSQKLSKQVISVMHQDLIITKKPLVIVHGSVQDIHVQKALDIFKNRLSQKEKQAANFQS